MEIFLAIVILVVSFVLIIWGGDLFVNSSVAIAKKLKIPTSIIGATLVSIGTTIPEILVTIFSITKNASGVAVGNAVGSVIFNTCVNVGILLCCTILLIKKSLRFDYLLLILALISLFVFGISGNLSVWGSIFLLIIFITFFTINIVEAVKCKKENDNNDANPLSKEQNIWVCLLIFVISASMIGVGAYFMVEKAKFLAQLAGLSELFIGLTIVAFGTSLPELITTINSIRKKEPELGFGNIIGANIINATLLVGLTGTLSGGIGIDKETLFVTIPVSIVATLFLLLPPLIKHKTYKWQGFCILGLYVAYYVFLILNATGVIRFA